MFSFAYLSSGSEWVPNLAGECVVVPGCGGGAEDAHPGVPGVGVDVAHPPRDLDLKDGVEGALALVVDLGLDLQLLLAPHQVGGHPEYKTVHYPPVLGCTIQELEY